jgi:hypothetical protein
MKNVVTFFFAFLLSPSICISQNDKMISPELWLDNQPGIFLGLLLILIGIVFFFVFFSKRKPSELHLLFLAIFVLGYGLRVISENELVTMSLNIPESFWDYITSTVTNILPVFFILFLKSFSGWGWKRSIYWLLLLWIAYGLFAIIAGIVTGIPDFIGGTVINNIMVILIVVVLSFNRFLSREKRTREGRIIEIGIIIFILAVLYNNLAPDHFFLSRTIVEQTAFFFFICCLIYASFLRSSRAEMEYLSILHDLETARQIQRAILPQDLPVSSSYSIFPSYIPMTLLGGDFYDIHTADDHHLGVRA